MLSPDTCHRAIIEARTLSFDLRGEFTGLHRERNHEAIKQAENYSILPKGSDLDGPEQTSMAKMSKFFT